MGLIRIATTAGYAASSTSQSNIGTATALGFAAVVKGDLLLNAPATPGPIVWTHNGSGSYRLRIRVGNTGGTVTIRLVDAVSTTVVETTYAAASLSSSTLYIVEAYRTAGADGIGLYALDGTQLAANTGAGGSITNSGTGYGAVIVGSPTGGSTGDVDALAIYSGVPGNTGHAEPTTGDSGILAYWAVTDAEAGTTNAANAVGGGVALDTFSNASIVSGGSWNGGAAPSTNIKAISNYYRRLRAA